MSEPRPLREPEDALFERWCRRGDARALGELFDALAPRLLKVAIHLVGDAVEAEDLVQATFLTALERRSSVDPSRAVMPWLTGVLAHKAQQHRRRAARLPDAARLPSREVEDASRPLERRELDGEVARAIDGLGEPYRSVLVLRLRHGMEAADIAHVLERDPGTVRVQLHRGLEKLRAVLPAALASSLVLGSLAPRGLAAVKTAVLEGAAAAAAGGSASLVLGGALVSEKVIVGAVLAALAALFWLRGPSREAVPRPAGGGGSGALARQPASPALAPLAAPGVQREQPRAPAERQPVAPAAVGTLLRGRVVDAESKQPLAGASLRFFPPHEASAIELQRDGPELYEIQADGSLRARTWGDWPRLEGNSAAARLGGERLRSFDRPRPGEEPLQVARADEAGGFALELAMEGVLEVESPGHATRWRPVRTFAEPLTVELWREREVRGVVLGPDLEPVPDIELVLAGARSREWRPAEPAKAAEGARLQATPILDEEEHPEAFGVWRVRTDEAGRFRALVGASSLEVTPLTPGWGKQFRQHHGLEGQELTVQLVRLPGFHFFDGADRAPIERVRLLGSERSNQYVRWAGEFFARDGWLAVPGDWSYATSEPGTLAFVAWSEGYAPARVSVTDLANAGTIAVPMERGAVDSLQGVVRRAGAPVAGAEAVLLGHSPLHWGVDEDFYVDATRTAADGRFRLSAPSGSYILRVGAGEGPFLEKVTFADRPNSWLTRAIQGHEPYYEVVELPARAPLVVDLGATSTIEVEIVDTLGTPRREHVIALRADDGRQAIAHTDERGRTRFGNLPAGRFELHTPHVSTLGSWGGGALRDVELAPATTEHVRIELPLHLGPRHARVVARDTSSYAGWAARYDRQEWQPLASDGTVPMDLTTDRFELEIAAADGRHWHLPIPKEALDGHVIELDGGTGRYRGVLRRADGTPWAGVDVHAVPWASGDARTRVSCITDERGEFELAGLGAGEYRLRFQTCLARTVWDEWENELASVSFAPAAPPSEDGTWLTLTAAAARPRVRIHGTVVDARGAPVRDARAWFEGEEPGPDGRFLTGGRDHLTHTDEHGAFELELPRTPRITVRVDTEEARGPALTHSFEPSREDETLRLVVP